ncbi:MAG: phosphoribosylformylglycinamidine synthase subunit PurS [Bacteroidetes bacterium]|nr:phosphoribosylformylglycinamidine synthase subunit PurS [Bacteroidota bacterium]
MFISKINIRIRDTILDPQGKAVEHSLQSIGFNSVKDTRIGKYIELKIDASTEKEAGKITEEACRKLLANPVMEDYEFEIFPFGEKNK